MPAAAPNVELHGIVKHFGAVQALRAWEAAAARVGLSARTLEALAFTTP